MRFAALRQPRTAARIAFVLWTVWAVIVWHVVFDHTIVVAGREYIVAAGRAADSGRYENMDAWMRPAVTRGLRIATGASGVLFFAGLILVRAARAPRWNR